MASTEMTEHMHLLLSALKAPISSHTAVQALSIAYAAADEAHGLMFKHSLEKMLHATDERPAFVRMTQPASEGVEAKFAMTVAGEEYVGTLNAGECVARMCRHMCRARASSFFSARNPDCVRQTCSAVRRRNAAPRCF
jgi:hypothetical protein